MRMFLRFAASAVVAWGLGAQRPPQQVAPASGLILGRVVDADSGRPIPGALVTLSAGTDRPLPAPPGAPANAGPPRVLADRDGYFLFRDLPPGSYNVTVTLAGYTAGAFGRRRPEGPARPVDLSEGEKILDATVRVWKLASITGTVTDEVGEPAVDMSVTAFRRVASAGRRRLSPVGKALTDDRGQFRFASLVPGEYVVAVPFTVASVPGALVAELFEVSRTGPPPQDVEQRRVESGAPLPRPGLAIGDQQVLIATSPIEEGSTLPPASPDGRLFVYQTAYFGGSTSLTEAATIALGSGESRTGVDIRLKPVPAARVSGTVTGPDGPAGRLGIRLVPVESTESFNADLETAVTMTDGAGRFTFPVVATGQYLLKAFRVPQPRVESRSLEQLSIVGGVAAVAAPGPGTTPGTPVAPSLWAQVPVSVGADDIDGVVVTLRRGIRVAGRVEFDGAAPRPPPARLQQMSVTLQPVDGRTQTPASAAAGRLDAEGRFTTEGHAPGRYWINVSQPGPMWAVRSIQVGAADNIESPIALESDDVGNVVITLTDRIAELTGAVTSAPNADDEISVVVFPADYASWIANGQPGRRSARVVVGLNGAFRLRLPPPGEYLAIAVVNWPADDGDVKFYASLARQATRLTVTEGAKRSLSLTAVRVR